MLIRLPGQVAGIFTCPGAGAGVGRAGRVGRGAALETGRAGYWKFRYWGGLRVVKRGTPGTLRTRGPVVSTKDFGGSSPRGGVHVLFGCAQALTYFSRAPGSSNGLFEIFVKMLGPSPGRANRARGEARSLDYGPQECGLETASRVRVRNFAIFRKSSYLCGVLFRSWEAVTNQS